MLARLVSCSDAKFFFLLDALDECDPQDSHDQLANEIVKISQMQNVKPCVSCRPWRPFVSRFRHLRTSHLDRMTYRDMQIYISSRLASADTENDLCLEFRSAGKTKRATEVVAGLAIDAEGVFLWTELVVKALGSELRKGCDFKKLQKTRSDFPIGLDEHLQRLVFDRIARTRQNTSDTAAALMLALKIAHGHDRHYRHDRDSFLNFWLLATGQLAAGFAWTDHNGSHCTREDVEQMVGLTSNFLQETCKDLLVVVKRYHYDTPWNVEFLHRTVSDFLHDTHLRLLIEQQSPKHFHDASFLDELGRLRCVQLLHMTWDSYNPMEDGFHHMARVSRASFPRDVAWLSKCEALMTCNHQRLQDAGNRHLDDHNTAYISDFVSFGLANYVLAIMASWPHIAMSVRVNSILWNYREESVLPALLKAQLRSMFAEPHIKVPSNTAVNGTSSVVTSWSLIPSNSTGIATKQRFSFTVFRRSLIYTMGDQRIKLLEHLLGWGLDVNAQSCEHFDMCASFWACHRSIWQNWLTATVLKVRSCNREISSNECSDEFRITLECAKKSISDIVVALLRYGADPDCAICISDHHDGGPCRQVSLESALETISPQDRLGQIQDLPTMQSTRFNGRAIQHRQMRRAM